MSEDPGQVPPANDPGNTSGGESKWLALIKSRKFWAALIGLALVMLKGFKPDFPLSDQEVTNLIYVLVAYILGVGIEGFVGRKA
jgi:hypothetical protein